MNKVTIKAHINASNPNHLVALDTFLKAISSTETSIPLVEVVDPVEVKPRRTRKPKEKTPVVETEEKTSVTKTEDKKETAKTSKIKIEDVRSILAQKVKDHRQAIKDKLTELDAANVTSLDTEHYEDFMSFLKAL